MRRKASRRGWKNASRDGKGSESAMKKLCTLHDAIARLIPDGSSIALGLQMGQMIPFAAGHEIMRQKKRGLTLIGPISDILFDQIIGANSERDRRVTTVIAAWVGNVMMGSAYNFRRVAEKSPWARYQGNPGAEDRLEGFRVFNMSNFAIALALTAGAMGVPFLPTRSGMGSDTVKNNHFFYQILSPFQPQETLLAVRAIRSDVSIVH